MTNFKIGQLVKYSKPANQAEKDIRFVVLEISPELDGIAAKLTVQAQVDMQLKPISTYFASEFEAA